MVWASQILASYYKMRTKKRRAAKKTLHAKGMPPRAQVAQNNAVEQTLRARNLEMQVIAARNGRLDALKAAGLRNELQRVEQLLHATRASPHASVLETASKLKSELRTRASK